RRRLAFAQLHHQIEKLAGIVALERDDELLVVEAVRVRRVQPNRRVFAANRNVLVHHPLALRLGKRVPGERLDERIDEEVVRRARPNNEPLFVRLIGNGWKLVDRAPCHRQVAVGNREIAAETGAVESGLELDEGVQIFGDLPEQEVTVAANAY